MDIDKKFATELIDSEGLEFKEDCVMEESSKLETEQKTTRECSAEKLNASSPSKDSESDKKRGRGRPPKPVNTLDSMDDSKSDQKKKRGRPAKKVATVVSTNDSSVGAGTAIEESKQDKKDSETDTQAKKSRRVNDDSKESSTESSSRKRVNESPVDENHDTKLLKMEGNAEENLKNSQCTINNELISDGNNNNDEQNTTASKKVKTEQQVEPPTELDCNTKNNEQVTIEAENKKDAKDCVKNVQNQTSESKNNETKTSCSQKNDEQSAIAIDKVGKEVLPGCSAWSDEQVYAENKKIDGHELTEIKQEVQIKQEYFKNENEKCNERQKMSTMKNMIANIVESSNEGVKRKFSEEMDVLRAQLVDARAERRRAQNLEEMVSNLKDENKKLKDELEKEKKQRKSLEREIAKLDNNNHKLQGQSRRTSGSELAWMENKFEDLTGISLSESENEVKGWGITIRNERYNRTEEPLAANKRQPLPLPRDEVDYELQERENRLNNVVLKGMDYIGRKTLNKVNLMMEEEIGWRLKIQEVTQIGSKTLLLKMDSKKDKTELMSNRSRFLKWGLTLENDLTSREKEVQEWIQDIVETEQARGRESHAKHLRVFLKGKWFLWDERKAKLV